jgi:hypothetical protein
LSTVKATNAGNANHCGNQPEKSYSGNGKTPCLTRSAQALNKISRPRVSLTQLNSIALAQTVASGRKEGPAAHGNNLNGFSFGLSRANLRLKNEEQRSSPQLPSVQAQEAGGISAEKGQYSGILLKPRFNSD